MNWSIPIRKALTGLIYWLLCPLIALLFACILFDQPSLNNLRVWEMSVKVLMFCWMLRQIIRFAIFFARRNRNYYA